jgi:phosphoribosylformylglycinamidine (FGAM) synthase PurS component
LEQWKVYDEGHSTYYAKDRGSGPAGNGVRQGKVIELDLAEGTSQADVAAMCEKLLANTVIESYRVELG